MGRSYWIGDVQVVEPYDEALSTDVERDAAVSVHNTDAAAHANLPYVPLAGGTSTGEQIAPDFKATGKTGATTNPLILAGGTSTGPPTTGSHVVGEMVTDANGLDWFCIAAGTPGTWTAGQSLLSQSLLTSGEASIARFLAQTASAGTLSNQALRLTFFTARKTEAITQIRIPSGPTAAAATPTVCRVGIYSVAANGDGTLVQSIANDTTLWAAGNTDYLRSLSGTFNKVAGQRYAMGWLCVTGATAPTIPGFLFMGAGTPGNNASARAPRIGGSLSGQSDLPASFTDAGLAVFGVGLYGELVP